MVKESILNIPDRPTPPKEMSAGARLKTISLVFLIGQTTALVLFLRYSRTEVHEGPRYVSSSAVFVSEVVKVLICLLVLLRESGWRLSVFKLELDRDVFSRPADFFKMSIPAVLYVVQNNLLFLALSKLDAATYQVTYQLKILTTAFFTVTMLKRSLNRYKWVSLVLLTVGVALVQMPTETKEREVINSSDKIIGLAAVVSACLTSGFAGVFVEKVLKTGGIGLWMRNLQLAFFSIFGAASMCFLNDWEAIGNNGLLAGYNWVVWSIVALQAVGGLVIGLVVKFADNILKGFAVSLSILLSSFVSFFFLNDFHPSWFFLIGATIVIGSTFLYGMEEKKPVQPPHQS